MNCIITIIFGMIIWLETAKATFLFTKYPEIYHLYPDLFVIFFSISFFGVQNLLLKIIIFSLVIFFNYKIIKNEMDLQDKNKKK